MRTGMMITVSVSISVCGMLASAAGAAGPDLTVSDITGTNHYGQIGGIHAYSVAGTLCNVGDAPVGYSISDADHPVVAQNMYRLVDGRFEQIGLSWLFNTTIPVETGACGTCQPSGSFDALGVGCSDPNGAGLAGSQNGLSRRSEVDPAAGVLAFPQDSINQTGDAIYKRLQVRASDLSVPGARYFVELQCVAPDDSVAANGGNNATWREVVVGPSMNLSFVGGASSGEPAVYAWAQATGAMVTPVAMPFLGTAHVGSLATDNGDGTWTYDYVVHNLDADLSIGAFTVPFVGGVPTGLGFHDVDYHSGEPFDGTDWAASAGPLGASWETEASADNPNANAIRWGTSYSFRLVSDMPPVQGYATLNAFDDAGLSAAAAVWLPDSPCPADFAGGDGVLNFFDVAAFIDAFVAGHPAANVAAPFDTLNFHDISAFVSLYNAGCP